MPRNRKSKKNVPRPRRKVKGRSRSQILGGRFFFRKVPGLFKSIVNNAVEMWVPGTVTTLTASSSVVSTTVALGSGTVLPMGLLAQLFTEYTILQVRITFLPTSITDNGYMYCQFNEKDSTAITSLAIAENSDAFVIMLNQGGGQDALIQYELKVSDYLDLEYRDTDSGGTIGYLKFYCDGVTLVGLGTAEQVARVKLDYFVRLRGRNNESALKNKALKKALSSEDHYDHNEKYCDPELELYQQDSGLSRVMCTLNELAAAVQKLTVAK